MDGANSIKFCQAEMIRAMETYLKDHVFKDKKFQVTCVNSEDRVHFEIHLKGEDSTPPDKE